MPTGCAAVPQTRSTSRSSSLAHAAAADAVIPADAWRDDEALYVQFDLPGMDRSRIELTVERDTLTADR
jgi:HSP20 family protein